MAILNKVMLIGRLTDNPEPPRVLPNSGSTVVKFRFAVGISRKNDQGGWDKDPNQLYIDCEVFSRPDSKRNLTELITQYGKKGDQLYVEGRLQLDQWEDKNGGGKRSKHKIVVDNVQFLSGRNADGGGGGDDEGGGGGGRQYGGGGSSGGSRQTGGGRTAAPPQDSSGHLDDFGGGGSGNAGHSGGGGDDPIPF